MRGGLATCALRPSGIFGEHDPLFVPSLVNNARKGKMKYIIGKGTNMMEWTYVGNVAQAHIQVSMCSQLCVSRVLWVPMPSWRSTKGIWPGLDPCRSVPVVGPWRGIALHS